MRHTGVPHEFHRVEHDVGGAIVEGGLESIDDVPAVNDREAFVRDCVWGDVAAQAFEGVTLMSLARGAGMEGESLELSDTRSAHRGIGCDGAQGQGLAHGMGAGGDAVVDRGGEDMLAFVDEFDVEVEGGGLAIAQQQPLLLL